MFGFISPSNSEAFRETKSSNAGSNNYEEYYTKKNLHTKLPLAAGVLASSIALLGARGRGRLDLVMP